MMRLLVTGGAGFIGSNFIRYVLESLPQTDRPEYVVNLDKLTYAGNRDNLADLEKRSDYLFLHGDIADTEKVERLLREHQITAIVHFAAESHVDRSIDSPEAFVQTNTVGTFRLLEAARRHWRGLEGTAKNTFRFHHVSTDEVYGSLDWNDPAFTEKTAHAPNSPYSASKAASDHFVRAYHHTFGLPTVATNCSNNYGPYQFPEKLIPLILHNAIAFKPLPVYGDGKNIRDWLYVLDHCKAIWLVLNRGRVGETYNIGGLNEISNIEIVRTLCAHLDKRQPRADGKPHADQIEFVPDRPGHDRRYAIDCTKITTELGWKPEETFSTGLEKTINWYLANGPWRERIQKHLYQQQRLGAAHSL